MKFEDGEHFLQNYRLLRSERPTRDISLSGGVLIGVKSTLLTPKTSIINIPGTIKGCLFLKNGKKMLLISIYKHPDDSPHYQTLELLTPVVYDLITQTVADHFIIGGDMKLDKMQWGDCSSNNASQQNFIDMIIEKDMEEIVDLTRVQPVP